MTWIKDFLPSTIEEFKEILAKQIESGPFMIGDDVRTLTQDTNEKWTIHKFHELPSGEPVALLESETFSSWALIKDIQFY